MHDENCTAEVGDTESRCQPVDERIDNIMYPLCTHCTKSSRVGKSVALLYNVVNETASGVL
jgi:hypothetical protein